MGLIDYSKEPTSDIAFIDMKSFYASVECVMRGLDPLTTSLCVLSRADHANGLILASSPTFKQIFDTQNVGRAYALPFDIQTRKFHKENAGKLGIPSTKENIAHIEEWAAKTFIVPPRMGLYIEKNLEIQEILLSYVSPDEFLPYSIDEGFIDASSSLDYFYPDPLLDKKEKLNRLSRDIQRNIFHKTGIYSTVGMSNSNPLLAKLALDNEAKKTKHMRANWSYEDVEEKVWNIPKLTDFWGIGRRTEKRLHRLGIHSVRSLALSDPELLAQEFGVIGLQLWFHAHGVDESNLSEPYKPKSKVVGNSQVLPKDYHLQRDIEIVLKEMAEQVAIRLRRLEKKTTLVAIHLSYSKIVALPPIQIQEKIEPTQTTATLQAHVLQLFRKKYQGGPIRTVSVQYGGLVSQDTRVYSLFDQYEQIEKQEKLEQTIDRLREKYGFLSVQPASVLKENSRTIARSSLIGGHSAGGLDGLA